MVIYEVSVEVDKEIAPAYELWLKEHIVELVKMAGFDGAKLFTFDSGNPLVTNWVTHYQAKSLDLVQNYLEKLAPSFRADGVQRFGKRFRAQRRILTLTE